MWGRGWRGRGEAWIKGTMCVCVWGWGMKGQVNDPTFYNVLLRQTGHTSKQMRDIQTDDRCCFLDFRWGETKEFVKGSCNH